LNSCLCPHNAPAQPRRAHVRGNSTPHLPTADGCSGWLGVIHSTLLPEQTRILLAIAPAARGDLVHAHSHLRRSLLGQVELDPSRVIGGEVMRESQQDIAVA